METKRQGPYRSGLSRMNAQSVKEERPNELKSLKTKIVGVKKANEYAEKVLNEGKLYDDDVIRGRNKTSFSETEKSSKVSKAALKEAAKLLGDIEHSKKGEEGIEEHRALVQGSFALNQMSGKPILDTTLDAVNSVIERYYKDVGSIELGGDEYAKGEGPGHELAVEAVKHTLDIVKEELAGVDGIGEDAEFQRQMRELAKIDPEEAIRQVSGLVKLSEDQNTILKQFLNKVKFNKSTLTNATSLNSANDVNLNPIKTITEKILTQNKVEGASERVADDKEVKASRKMINVATSDADSGFNTDQKADTLISRQEKTNKILGKETQEKLNDIISKIGTKSDTDDTRTSSTSLLQIISDNVQAIRDKLLGKQRSKHKNTSNQIGFDTSNIKSTKTISDVILGRFSSNFPAIIKQSLQTYTPGKFGHPSPNTSLIPVDNTEKTLDKSVAKGVNLWEYDALVKNRKQEEDKRIRESTRTNEEILREIADTKNSSRYGVRTPKVIELEGFTETIEKTFPNKLKDIFNQLSDNLDKVFGRTTPSANAEQIMQMSEAERAKETAYRLNKYGMTRGMDLSDTGAKARYRYSQALWSGDKRVNKNSNLFSDVRLTEGIGKVDTNSILEELKHAIEKNMFNAQTGGGFRNILGAMTGYIGMPSLEKSRAQVDGLNQVMADVREQVINILNDLIGKETTLKATEAQGQATFNSEGVLVNGTPEAHNLFTDMENEKDVLRSALAEVENIDEVVRRCRGNVGEILKQLGFVMPELRQQNLIIQNLNAGLDKNGKALKFQNRTAETLNYSFQLMARSIGQMWKNWMMMMNPINLLKKAFADFASYDVKWQRTMNVIKYNLRRIIRPMMEWIAQQLVNMIGLVNALIKGIGAAFGKDWDLFDQDAANAEKIREELEQAANVSAGFDELHDISGETGGSDASMNLMGDIYKPEWDGIYKVLEDIGSTIGKIMKAVSDWSFWDWLILVGAALAGYLALKWLIGLFSKKNPLEAVAKGFSFLEKAVGWALLIWAFTSFTKALTEFVECMKTADWEDIVKALVMLGGAFAELVASILILEKVSKIIGTSAGEMIGLAALVWVFGEFVKAVIPFIECIKELIKEGVYWETLGGMILGLISAFGALIGGVAALEGVTKAIGLMGPELLGLAAVVGVFSLFVSALTPFIEMIHSLGDNKISTIVGTFGALVSAFLALAVGVGTVSKTFSTMDWSAIGQLAVVALVFDIFMMSLIPFVNAIKDVPFEALAGGAVLIAGAFLSLGGAIALMAPAIKTLDFTSIIAMAGMVGVFALLTAALVPFTEALHGLSDEQLYAGLALMIGTITAVGIAIGVLAAVFTAIATTGIGLAALGILAGILAICALIIYAMADLVRAMGESGEGIKLILEGVATVIESIGTQLVSIYKTVAEAIIGIITAIGEAISTVITSIGDTIATVVNAVATGIEKVLTPIVEFIDNVLEKIIELATTVAHEVGETIRTVIETVGEVIVGIIDSVVNAIQNLMNAILNFIRELGPAIDSFVTSLCNTITKMVNFIVSAFEYILNIGVDVINGLITAANKVPGVNISYASKVSIPRFVPQYEQGTNYVPSDGLAYLHQGEAVIPKKYNTPYNPAMSSEEKAYMQQMISTMKSLDGTIKQGIPVSGQFTQRGSDLVAVVNRTKSQTGADVLSNVSYAR